MKTILVIDDTPEVLDYMVDTLQLEGFKVLTAENGHVGIEQCKQHLPDLILCDVMMPVINGYDVLEALHQDPATEIIPFIFVTSKKELTDFRKGMELGADDYLSKPFSDEELLHAVKTRLEHQAVAVAHFEKKLEYLRKNLSRVLPHELNTPIAGILGFSQVLAEFHETMKREEISDMARGIYVGAKRLHNLIQECVKYTEIEMISSDTAKLDMLRKMYVLHPESVVEKAAKQIAGEVHREQDLVMELVDMSVHISKEHFQTIAQELIHNAFKFSKKGEPVHVKTMVKENDFILQIENKGGGLKADQIVNIGAFMQFDRDLREQQGIGLGLIIAKSLAELYDGKLTFASIPNQSTTISVILPHYDPSLFRNVQKRT